MKDAVRFFDGFHSLMWDEASDMIQGIARERVDAELVRLAESIDEFPKRMWAKREGASSFLESMAESDFPPRGFDCALRNPKWREHWWNGFFTAWIWYLNRVKYKP